MTAPWYSGGEGFYCRHEGKHSQRHPSPEQRRSRGLNMAVRLDLAMRGEKVEEREEEKETIKRGKRQC